MAQQHSTPENTHSAGGTAWSGQRPQCQICGERDGQGIVATKNGNETIHILTCGECFIEAHDPDVRLWRRSLALVIGGWPR